MNKKASLAQETLENSVWDGIASIIQRIGGLIFTLIIARFLLPEGFGLYNLLLAITSLFFIFVQGGIDKALIRYLSEAKTNKKKGAYFKYILKTKLIFLACSSLLLFILIGPITSLILKKQSMVLPLLMATIYTFLLSFDLFFAGVFFALKKVKYRAIKESISQLSRIFLILLAFFMIANSFALNATFIVLIFSSLISIAYSMYSVWRVCPEIYTSSISIEEKDKKRIFIFSTYFSLTNLSMLFFGNLDIIVLGFFISETSALGIYKAAFLLVANISGFLIFSNVLMTAFVQAGNNRLERIFNKTFRYVMIVTIPAAFGLISLGNYAIMLIYGYEYLSATTPLIFLSFLIVFSIQADMITILFSVKEKPKEYLPLLILAIILNFVLDVLLIKYFSYSIDYAITAAAVASLITWIFYSAGLNRAANKKLNIKINNSSMLKPLISSLIMVFFVFFLKQIFQDINIINGIFLIFFGVIVYFSSLYLIKGITKEDYFILKVFLEKQKIFLTNLKIILKNKNN